ncbi:MAG TPA: hypothetical protein VIK78_03365 [Ruminiclostridium sp.]
MKKYLSGSWAVLKDYLFAMIFFYIFFVGFYSKASLFSILIFIIMCFLIYGELSHLVGVDKRKYGSVKFYDGAIYALIGIAPIVIIQIIISQLNLSSDVINFDVLKVNLVKGFVAPMLFIVKLVGYSSIWGYVLAWTTIVIASFLGYFAGYKGFDLDMFIRRLFGLQPRKKKPTKKNRRY